MTEKVKISANTLDASELRYNAALYPFGTSVFELPPKQKSTVTHDCTMDLDMKIFVMFPHMHRLGTEMAFQVGKDAASLADVWRGKYDFDNQQLLPTKIIKDSPQLNRHCVDISGLDLSKIFGNGKDAGADAEAGSVP